jgi:hypothetical protein
MKYLEGGWILTGYPQSISKHKIPKAHQSTAFPWPFDRTISGARYFARRYSKVSATWRPIKTNLLQVYHTT